MADNLTEVQRKRNMSNIRSRNTKPELVVRSIIHKLGLRFRLHARYLPGKPDIVLPRHKKIVLVHGCFWHMHKCKRGKVFPKTNELYWAAKRNRNVERDRLNKSAYKKAGWQTLIIWECESRDVSKLSDKLARFFGVATAAVRNSC